MYTNQGSVDSATQTSDGAGASPLTSLEEKQMMPTTLRAELTAQDHQLAELKTKLDHEKLLNQELEKNVSRLQADNAVYIELSTAANLRIKDLQAKVGQRDVRLLKLEEESADMAEEVKCLRGLLKVSLYSRTIMLKPYCKVAGSNLTCRDDSKTRWQLHSVDPTSTRLSLLGQNIIHSSIARVVYG